MRARFLAFALALGGLLAGGAEARVGDSRADIKLRYGKPSSEPNAQVAVWLFEHEDGQLLFTVTFNAAGVAIAEGLKPFKRVTITPAIAEDFILGQLSGRPRKQEPVKLPPGQPYVFAGRKMTCGADEEAMLDVENEILVVWNRGRTPSLLAIGREMAERL